MNLRYFLFMWLGTSRTLLPEDQKEPDSAGGGLLTEPQVVRAYRRNILALSGIVVVAGFAGADPNDIAVFGIRPDRDRGVWVIGGAVILVQLYWYVMRHQHLKEDGIMRDEPPIGSREATDVKISWNRFRLTRKGEDFWANCMTVLLTVVSWGIVGSWFWNLIFP